ncbi:MAG: N-6 DNA methylase [Methanoregula sp.]|nr:MAG: N-6 DNA methylase [Methanoregula sp.]
MALPETIITLLNNYDFHRTAYRKSTQEYNEARLRRDFLDPFFKELGWDMDNKKGYSERYREVGHEQPIKIQGQTEFIDYTFRIGGMTKFIVEAKAPSVNIKNNRDAALQVRGYAWSAKIPLCILTNFEEFAIYDCTKKPLGSDAAVTARDDYFTYNEYPKKWDLISSIFSQDGILKGSFDKYVTVAEGKKGTASVDESFLIDIENWREQLAKNIELRNQNPSLSVDELNLSVQTILDRIIFLRFCEDRDIETYETLKSFVNNDNIYKSLCDFFKKADAKYNSGLFHFNNEPDREQPDIITPNLVIDDKIIKNIILELYPPKNYYLFSAIPPEILGQVYEQFLGKVIRITEKNHIKIEEKPEVKKAGGIYYTPQYIVDYIVKNTLEELLKNKTQKDVSKIHILDPACGSGSFLLGAYQFLLNWHLEWYLKNLVPLLNPEFNKEPKPISDPDIQALLPEYPPNGKKEVPIYNAGYSKEIHSRLGDRRRSDWKLTTSERKRILLHNIFGVDIDHQAVEVTKLSLLLKVLEEENEETMKFQLEQNHGRALPSLHKNIKCGNSLIEWDILELQPPQEEVKKINAFDWEQEFPDIINSGGFDVVIGNPPYDVLEKERGKSSWPHYVLSDYVKMRADYSNALGGKLNLYRFFLVRCMKLTKNKGFFGMIVPLSILGDISCTKTRLYLLRCLTNLNADCFPQKDNPKRRVFLKAKLSTCILVGSRENIDLNDSQIHVRVYPWNKFDDLLKECRYYTPDLALLDPINYPVPLVDENNWNVCKKIYTTKNIKRLEELGVYLVNRGEINQTVFRKYISEDTKKSRLLKGVEVGRYFINPILHQGFREWFDDIACKKDGVEKPIALKERIATQRITGVDDTLRIIATLISPPTYFADSTNSITLSDDTKYSLEYLLGLLNSKLFQWRFRITSSNNNVGTNELECLPTRIIDFNNPTENALHARLVSYVKQMLNLNTKLQTTRDDQEKTVIQRQIIAIDNKIELLIFELYGLTENEIKIIQMS